ncbi:MAG: hypothetical protein SXU28_07565 [Pseudomonadota bacterium]|nr:hypothetical protein [Pseudomonadota bacterium]
MSDIDALLADYGDTFTLVVDACQARITTPAIEKYLDRGAIILMTGSKFIGAPPFNGWAIVPAHISGKAHCLPDGFATIFRSAEWPDCWPGRNALPSTSNLSLALRLEAAIFELERFQQIEMQKLTAMIDAFERALEEHVIAPLAIRRVLPSAGGSKVECPIEMRTLLTLDMTQLPSLSTIEDAQAIHRSLAFDGIRLGQPVKCVRKADGWGGTLRIGLSMPQLIRWAGLPLTECKAQLAHDMSRIANAISQQVALIQR